jgi:hypothetical protein
MDEYIDREALLEEIDAAMDADGMGFVVGTTLKRYLKRQKVADVTPVVRCKDCKWYQEGEKLSPNKFCFRLQHPTENRKIGYNFSPDDFCSYGEKKDCDGNG